MRYVAASPRSSVAYRTVIATVAVALLAIAVFVWALLFAVAAGAQENTAAEETTLMEESGEEQAEEPQAQTEEQNQELVDPSQEEQAVEAQAQAKLTIKKTDSPDPVAEGKTLTYKVIVKNTGNSTATGVEVTDNLPDATKFVSAGTSRGTCPDKPNQGDPGTDDPDVRCDIGNLPAGKTATVTTKVEPTSAGTITNRAEVTANGGAIDKD